MLCRLTRASQARLRPLHDLKSPQVLLCKPRALLHLVPLPVPLPSSCASHSLLLCSVTPLQAAGWCSVASLDHPATLAIVLHAIGFVQVWPCESITQALIPVSKEVSKEVLQRCSTLPTRLSTFLYTGNSITSLHSSSKNIVKIPTRV